MVEVEIEIIIILRKSCVIASTFIVLYFTDTFGKNCSVDLERIHDHADIFVMYDGEQLHETCNDMSFSGFDEDNPGDEYRTYNCDIKPDSRYCGKGKDSLFIDLKLLAVMTRDVRFKLQVEAELTFNYNSFVAAVVGGVIGGFVFICIVTGVIIFMTCKRKRSPGQVLTPVNRTEREVL
ncbi:unnamed protein product [Mytilus edulis]|uniref:Uncharacterized protein n=1 Tax=Mytilus edulis TaxID=6550 RepID=A0A8S3UJA5_MYTED|nr:unnamed protein product [Mytilus edulis]